MEGERPPPPDRGGARGLPGKQPSGGEGDGGGEGTRQPGEGGARQQHELFGDPNLALALMVLALFGLMQQMLSPPCTC